MARKLSYRQRETLREIKRAGAEGVIRGNTNSTMNALEDRGLVQGVYLNDHTYRCRWKLTSEGLAVLDAG